MINQVVYGFSYPNILYYCRTLVPYPNTNLLFWINLPFFSLTWHFLLNFFQKQFVCVKYVNDWAPNLSLFFFNLPIRRADLKQSNQIVTIRYIKQRGEIIIKNVIQNQRTKYIFWLMIFCDNTHNPLVSCSPPPAPTLGRVQLKKKSDSWLGNFSFFGFPKCSKSLLILPCF